MSDLDRLLQQVEELKKLAVRPDDSWMDTMSNDELVALGKRVRKVAGGLSGLQSQLRRQVPSNPMKPVLPQRAAATGSLGSMVRRDTSGSARPPAASSFSPPAPASPAKPYQNPFPVAASDAADLSNPMQRRRGVIPREAPAGPPRPKPPMGQRGGTETPPPGRRRPNA